MTCELLTSSPEPVAASWPISSLGMSQSSPSSGTATPAKSCASDSPACESLKAMCEPWTSRESWLESMRSALASLVRTSAQQAKAQASAESEAASTEKSCEQLTLFDLSGFFLKTAPSSEPEAGTSSSPIWWRVDTPGATDSLPRLMSEHLTSAIGGGALHGVPTPICNDAEKRGNFDPHRSWGLAAYAKLWPTPSASEFHTKDAEALIARRERCKATAKNGNGFGLTLGNAITLAAAGKWATPTARDWRSGKASEATMARNSRPLSEQSGGLLNPEWVEWLMGWPIGHTESKHWATAKCRSKPRSPGSRSAGRGRGAE